jgi:hypothetical protein
VLEVGITRAFLPVTRNGRASRIAAICEQAMTAIVNYIERIEPCSYTGMANVRVYFQPSAIIEFTPIKAVTETLPTRK